MAASPDLPHPAGTADEFVAARRRALVRLRRLMVAAIVIPTLAFLVMATVLWLRAFYEAGQRLERSARIAREHALKLFDTNQMLLQRMLDLVDGHADAELLRDGERLHRRLREMARDLPQVQGLFVIGADARMLASSRVFPPPRHIDYSDRDWYRVHRAMGENIFFTGQIISRSTGEAAFDMSQRRTVNAAFAGSVHVSLRPEYLSDFYRELAESEPGLRMAVLRRDGAMLARWPDPVPVDFRFPAGHPLLREIEAGRSGAPFTMRSATDGVMRLVAYRRLGTAPLYVVAAVDRQVIVQAWLRQLAVLLAVTLPVAWLVASHARAAMRRAREEIDALNRLAEETARRQRAEVALLQSQKLEAMGRLTGGVAHDFNNLLAVVSGNVEVLKRLSPQPAQLPRLEAIARAVTSGTQLTRQLLAFARKQALQPETVRLQQRLPQLLDMLRPLIGTSIDLTLAVDEDTAPVEVDPAELELALMNAAVNASDAMAGRGRLSIRVRNAREEDLPPALPAGPDGLVLIDVDDDGPGIDPAIASQVFEPFFTTKPMGQGTGLGLSQVRAFCHRSGGDALIAPAPGGGTRLRLLLQRSRSAQVPGATPDALPGRLDGARVLLVEDNAEVSQATRQLLEAMGAQVRCVPDASAALALLARRRDDVDVVLSDIQMPGPMDGIALAARLSADAVPVPVVLISGYTQRLEEAVNQNLNVLPKPVGGPRLAEALARAMGRPLQPRPA